MGVPWDHSQKQSIQSMQLYCMEVFVEFMLVMGITWGLGEVCQSC